MNFKKKSTFFFLSFFTLSFLNFKWCWSYPPLLPGSPCTLLTRHSTASKSLHLPQIHSFTALSQSVHVEGGFPGNTQFKNRKINTGTTDRQTGGQSDTSDTPGSDRNRFLSGDLDELQHQEIQLCTHRQNKDYQQEFTPTHESIYAVYCTVQAGNRSWYSFETHDAPSVTVDLENLLMYQQWQR